ncbi:hypothetical protein [Pseudonocardia nigra]|uniref:hypothetical protein n=1 Tax=Pseudonocardia nigra TaxID=1921578 RepID=UPI001C5E8FA0|nr:hypothetical protein [Pseudonocardia nigra]
MTDPLPVAPATRPCTPAVDDADLPACAPSSRDVHGAAAYRLHVDARRLVAHVHGCDGRLWFRLRLLAALDTTAGPDETVGEPAVVVDGRRVEVRCASTRWAERTTVLECHDDRLEVRTSVRGGGALTEVHLLGGRRLPHGFLPSGSALRTVVSPNPDHPRRIARPAVEPAVIGVVGDGAEPGVGRWLFAPAPWCFAVCREAPVSAADPRDEVPAGEWAALGLLAPIGEQTFTAVHYSGGTDGFHLRLDHEGHTRVDGAFTTPTVVVRFGAADPYAALRAHRDLLAGRGLVPGSPADVPAWWRQPMFCGWGAQHHLALTAGEPTQDFATQRHYDAFLAALAAHGVVPGTVVVDDKWQRGYARNEPDPAKWPDLAGWIAGRHERGQRVLLWYKAWDPEGAPPEACIRDPAGTPVALDPESPAGRTLIEESVSRLLAPDGLDADGLKVDFLARTPSGQALRHAGSSWGAALLHALLACVHRAAKRVQPDALVDTHAANPAFADVTDMLRLNDIRMLDAVDPDGPVVAHMAYRAAVVAAVCPGVPIDTDGWCLPDRAAWAEYVAVQPNLGVPALYYATAMDLTGEPLRPADLAAVARTWRDHRRAHALPVPRADQ